MTSAIDPIVVTIRQRGLTTPKNTGFHAII